MGDRRWPDDDMIEAAMGLICNAGGGNWGLETSEWQQAARNWVDAYGRSIKQSAEVSV